MRFETIIGLEIHIQLNTKTKMFCGCALSASDYAPNTAICPICLGHPGVLPVANHEAIARGLKLALALNATIAASSKFDRKHYFYPDLPKGYQISQYDEPLAKDGTLQFSYKSQKKKIRFERLHLEEDAAKLVHVPGNGGSLVDFNRAGTPLAELVTKPDFSEPEEAKVFLQELQRIVRRLGISEGDMEKGHLRCDANVSLRPTPETFRSLQHLPGIPSEPQFLWPKTEVKNMNSFRSVEHALAYEIVRQTALWEKGEPPLQQSTRGWNDTTEATELLRVKETSEDYRYLPDPDLPRVVISDAWLTELRAEQQELPEQRRDRFAEQYGLEANVRNVLVNDAKAGDFFEAVISEMQAWLQATDSRHEITEDQLAKLTSQTGSWVITKLFEVLGKRGKNFSNMKLSAENFAELMLMIFSQHINSSTAVTLLTDMVVTGADPSVLVQEKNMGQIDDEQALLVVVQRVIDEQADIVMQYKSGKISVIQFLVGQVMKKSQGRANPPLVKKMLETLLR